MKTIPTDNAHGSIWAAALLVLPFALLQPIRQMPTPPDRMAVSALANRVISLERKVAAEQKGCKAQASAR